MSAGRASTGGGRGQWARSLLTGWRTRACASAHGWIERSAAVASIAHCAQTGGQGWMTVQRRSPREWRNFTWARPGLAARAHSLSRIGRSCLDCLARPAMHSTLSYLRPLRATQPALCLVNHRQTPVSLSPSSPPQPPSFSRPSWAPVPGRRHLPARQAHGRGYPDLEWERCRWRMSMGSGILEEQRGMEYLVSTGATRVKLSCSIR